MYLKNINVKQRVVEENYFSEEELENIKKAERIDNKDFKFTPDFFNFTGMTALQNKNFEYSEKCFREALKSFPDNPLILNNLGQLYQNQTNFDKAMDYYKQSIDAMKKEENKEYRIPAPYNALGVLMMQGDTKENLYYAEECFKKALTINKDHFPTFFNLARLYFLKKKDFQGAEQFYLKAIELNDLSLPAYDDLAEMYFENKKHDAIKQLADRLLSSKLESNSDDPGIKFQEKEMIFEMKTWAYRMKAAIFHIDKEYKMARKYLDDILGSLREYDHELRVWALQMKASIFAEEGKEDQAKKTFAEEIRARLNSRRMMTWSVQDLLDLYSGDKKKMEKAREGFAMAFKRPLQILICVNFDKAIEAYSPSQEMIEHEDPNVKHIVSILLRMKERLLHNDHRYDDRITLIERDGILIPIHISKAELADIDDYLFFLKQKPGAFNEKKKK